MKYVYGVPGSPEPLMLQELSQLEANLVELWCQQHTGRKGNMTAGVAIRTTKQPSRLSMAI